MALNPQIGMDAAHENNDAERSPQDQVFTNDLVVEKIAGYLSIKDLKTCRMINPSCYKACMPTWRNKVFVRLDPSRFRGKVPMRQFVEKVYKVESIENYHVILYSLPPVRMSDEEVRRNAEFRFWKKCGPHMKSLILEQCEISQRTLLNLVCNLAPKLESLTIKACTRRNGVESQEIKHLLKPNVNLKVFRVFGALSFPTWKFLEYFPNLEELKLEWESDEHVFPTVCALRRERNFSILNLKTVDVIHTKQSWEGLDEARLPVEHLRLFLEDSELEAQLAKVLSSQCTTLKTIKLHQCPKPAWTPRLSSSFRLNFCSLTELHFWGQVMDSFNFLMWTPCLKVLVMDFMCHNMIMECNNTCSTALDQPFDATPYTNIVNQSRVLLEDENFQHLNLEHLHIDCRFSTESLKFLGKWLPNLKVLKTIVDNATLSVVCDQWRQLEKLQLLFESNVSDVGITGWVENEEDRIPNLTDLKELSYFGLDCYCPMSNLTDASVHNGFLQMPQLKTVIIHGSSRLSECAEKLLKKNVLNVEVIRNYRCRHPNELNDCGRAVHFYSDLNHVMRMRRIFKNLKI